MFRWIDLCSYFLLLSYHSVASQEPIKVYVSLYFNSVSKVDGVEQSFNADFYLTAYWIDNSVNDTYDPLVNFHPTIEFANSRGAVETQIVEPFSISAPSESVLGVPVEAGTWITYDQRYVGNFNTRLNLLEFPFDFQDAVLWIESAVYNEEQLVFIPVENLEDSMIPEPFIYNGILNDFQVLEWVMKGVFVNQTSKYYKPFDQTYSRLEIRIFLEREAEYYLWKIILGSILLVIMCICTFILEVKEPDRLMGTLTVFLALVSFLFVSTQSIPKVAYQTRLDNFFNFSFFVVFFVLLAHTLNYFLKLEKIEPHKMHKTDPDVPMKEEGEKEEGEKEVKRKKGKSVLQKLSFSRVLDIVFSIIFLTTYTVGCFAILIAPGAPQYIQKILDKGNL